MKIPIPQISEHKDELFKIYKKMLNPPRNGIKEIRKEFDIFILYDVKFMPYWLVLELIKRGFELESPKKMF